MSDPESSDVTPKVRAWYNLVADSFLGRYEGDQAWYLARCEEDLVHALLPLSGCRVLDLGTGGGRLLPRLSAVAREVIAADLSEALLARAPRLPNVRLTQMNALELGFPARTFDVVVSLGLCEYLSDLTGFLHEAQRVLKPGGVLAFTYHQLSAWRSPVVEAPETPYFGRTVAERSLYWQKQRHRRSEVLTALAHAGFHGARPHRVFFRASAALEGLALSMPPDGPGRRVARLGAVATEASLARTLRPVTQHLTGNVLMVARSKAV